MVNRRVKSSLEAEVDILLPNEGGDHPVVELLKREGIEIPGLLF